MKKSKSKIMKSYPMRTDVAVLAKIDSMAAGIKKSRNEYINRILENHIAKDEILEVENSYKTLVKNISMILEANTKEIRELHLLVEDLTLEVRELRGGLDE